MEAGYHMDVSLFPNELELMLSLIKTEEVNIGDTSYNKGLTDIDWAFFLELATHHRVFPTLYTKLKSMNEPGIPPYVMQSLRNDYQQNTFQMLHLSAEMDTICKLLSDSGIRSLVLKGPVLAADLYGDISQRTSGDLDILIPIEELEHAEQLLVRQGYEKDEYIQTVLNDWKWRHHHITFFHHHKGIKVEIHWRLGPGPGKEPSFQALWERRRTSAITRHPVYYLGREDLFLFLVSHGARHGWSRLRWLLDIDRMVKQSMDVRKLRRLLKQYEHLHIGAQALILASQLLHTPLTEEMRTLAQGQRARNLAQEALFYIRQMINLHTDPIPYEVSEYHKKHLFSLMSNHRKLLFILNFFYPYPEDANTLALPKYLHFLYFPLRPFLWVWRKTKKVALS
ncbi:nucleotidyltransferase domain-containing protein [Paenibacillus sp. UNC451MF]|uniref:nucleotidyltransferase domain-containing protein n=1 Tax=Paenibacillus sp. UNC451MF TaxID=1449063 RepID=UPI00048F0354|nr:nucleotidyltransferase family protein [Paenibacillus sp. UNC451MF]